MLITLHPKPLDTVIELHFYLLQRHALVLFLPGWIESCRAYGDRGFQLGFLWDKSPKLYMEYITRVADNLRDIHFLLGFRIFGISLVILWYLTCEMLILTNKFFRNLSFSWMTSPVAAIRSCLSGPEVRLLPRWSAPETFAPNIFTYLQ